MRIGFRRGDMGSQGVVAAIPWLDTSSPNVRDAQLCWRQTDQVCLEGEILHSKSLAAEQQQERPPQQ